MNSKLVDQIRSVDQEKIEIIKEIVQFHPGLRSDTKYAAYVGGFVDTGKWHWDVLLSEDIFVLKSLLFSLQKEEEKRKENQQKEEERRELVDKMTPEDKLQYYRDRQEELDKSWKEWFEKRDRFFVESGIGFT